MKILVNDLEFAYAREKILKNISLTVQPGECVSVLGPNGAGKSTLIKCLGKLLTPQKGKIRIDNKNIEEMSREQIARKLGYVPQSTAIYFPLKVFDMVLLGRRPYATWNSGKKDREKVLQVLSMLSLEHLAMKNFSEISGGQQQKVIIARVLAQETEVLLLDEPISNLDIRHQMEVMEIVKSLVEITGVTVVMIVHDLNIASRYSDKILIMNEGEIQASGTPEEVLTKEIITRVYGVEVSVNRIKGKPCIVPLKAEHPQLKVAQI